MKRLGALLASLLLAGSLTACGGTAAQEMQSIQVFAMDTVMGLRACGGETEAALAAAEDEIYRLDEAHSRTREDSAVSRLNSAAGGTPVDVGEELRDLIARALDFSAATDGAFDITLAPVSSAWGFTEDTYRVPEDAELALLLPCVGAEHVHLEEGTAVSLDQGTRIDLGAIAKGYASDWMAAIYQEHGITHGIVDLGGNTWVCGGNLEGEPWQIGIQDPARSAGALAGILEASDAFAVTSGGYQMCDALSTALFVMGEDRALELWRSGVYDFDLILVTEDGRLLATAGIADRFRPDDSAGYAYEIVS